MLRHDRGSNQVLTEQTLADSAFDHKNCRKPWKILRHDWGSNQVLTEQTLADSVFDHKNCRKPWKILRHDRGSNQVLTEQTSAALSHELLCRVLYLFLAVDSGGRNYGHSETKDYSFICLQNEVVLEESSNKKSFICG
jgi:hypothetical protein